MLLWDVLARSSAVLLAAALTTAALRGRSAALRHAVWACGIAGALAVAPLSWVLPTWHVPLVPAFARVTPATVAAPAADAPTPPVTMARAMSAPTPAVPSAEPASAAVATTSEPAPAVAPPPSEPVALPLAPDAPAPVVPDLAAATTGRISWGLWLMGIWALGSVLLFGRLGLANLLTFRALRVRTSTAPPWLATARRLARVSGVPHTHFVRAEAITMPMAAGYLRPTVALPAEADAWPDERVTSVLLHELAHIRRRDCLTQLAASTTCALYWMNPLAWYAARALRRERERACDDAVLVAGTEGPAYAEHLLDVARAARHVTTPTFSGGVAMAYRSELEGRLMAILDDARNRQSVSYGAAGLAGLLCLALVTPLAALDPWALAAAEAQPVAIPPGGGPEPPAPKAPRPSTPPRAVAPAVAALAPVALAADIVPPAPPAQAADALEPVISDVPAAAAAAVAVAAPVAIAPATPPVYAVARVATTAPVPPVPPAAPRARDMAFAFTVDVDMDAQTLPTPAPTPTPTPTPQPTPNPPNPPNAKPAKAERVRVPADPRVVSALAGALKDPDVEVRQQAAHSLGQMRDPIAVDALIPALQDADVEVRQNVVFALGQLRDVRAIPGLTIALKDANDEVRERAAFALSQLRDARAIDPLLIAAKDANPDVRRQALFAIGQIDASRGKDAAIDALKDKDAEVRRMAAHLLGRLAHER
jgi:beta-lactamase regulating signal transducer with metallopeptidase domain